MCDIEFDERCDVFREEPHYMATATFKGRPHECSVCGARITRGEPYLRHTSLFERGWTWERMCFACWWVREAFGDEHRVSFVPSMLVELLRECVVDGEDDESARWRKPLASILLRRRMAPLGRRIAARAAEYRRRWRGRTSWALGPGGLPRRAA